MRVSVMVLGDPAESSAVDVALRVLETARAAGHSVDTAFLYHKGAYAAVNSRSGCFDLDPWSRLATFGLDCIVCRTALTRITGEPSPTPVAPFRAGGLADWLAACERSDKVLRFGSLDTEVEARAALARGATG